MLEQKRVFCARDLGEGLSDAYLVRHNTGLPVLHLSTRASLKAPRYRQLFTYNGAAQVM